MAGQLLRISPPLSFLSAGNYTNSIFFLGRAAIESKCKYILTINYPTMLSINFQITSKWVIIAPLVRAHVHMAAHPHYLRIKIEIAALSLLLLLAD